MLKNKKRENTFCWKSEKRSRKKKKMISTIVMLKWLQFCLMKHIMIRRIIPIHEQHTPEPLDRGNGNRTSIEL